MSMAYGCCVGSWDKFERYVVPRTGDSPIFAVSGQTSIATAYNSILNACATAWQPNLDMLILQHDDLEIVDPLAIEKFAAVLADRSVGLVGVAGGSASSGLMWWNSNPIGHVRAETTMVDFGTHSGQVDLLEGCILVFSPWAIQNLRFAHREGFHGYDCDISMRAALFGKKVVVADVDVHHHTMLGFDDEASHADWIAADKEFRERWLSA